MLVFPFSKLLHAPGVFFSPTRNQVDNAREQRHLPTRGAASAGEIRQNKSAGAVRNAPILWRGAPETPWGQRATRGGSAACAVVIEQDASAKTTRENPVLRCDAQESSLGLRTTAGARRQVGLRSHRAGEQRAEKKRTVRSPQEIGSRGASTAAGSFLSVNC